MTQWLTQLPTGRVVKCWKHHQRRDIFKNYVGPSLWVPGIGVENKGGQNDFDHIVHRVLIGL